MAPFNSRKHREKDNILQPFIGNGDDTLCVNYSRTGRKTIYNQYTNPIMITIKSLILFLKENDHYSGFYKFTTHIIICTVHFRYMTSHYWQNRY